MLFNAVATIKEVHTFVVSEGGVFSRIYCVASKKWKLLAIDTIIERILNNKTTNCHPALIKITHIDYDIKCEVMHAVTPTHCRHGNSNDFKRILSRFGMQIRLNLLSNLFNSLVVKLLSILEKIIREAQV